MAFSRSAQEANEAADAMQAAHFRSSLVEERDHLARTLTKRRDEILQRMQEGQRSAATLGRLRSQMRAVEAEMRYIDGLITRLDRRFTNAGQLPN